MSLRSLPGLGPKSEEDLINSGISSVSELKTIGPLPAYLLVCDYYQKRGKNKPSMNLLYALVGAVENRHWQEVAVQDRESLVMALDYIQSQDEDISSIASI